MHKLCIICVLNNNIIFWLTCFSKLWRSVQNPRSWKTWRVCTSFNYSTGLVSLQWKRSSQIWEHAVQIHYCKFQSQSLADELRNNLTTLYLASVTRHTECDVLPGPLKKSCQTALHKHRRCEGLWLHLKNRHFRIFYWISIFYFILFNKIHLKKRM